MDLQPLDDRLVVEVFSQEETSAGGVIIPSTAQEKPQRGRVLAVGPGARNGDGEYMPIPLNVGDEIVFSKYGGTDVESEGEEYLIIRESDVLVLITHEDETE